MEPVLATASINHLGDRLLHALDEGNTGENLLFSPCSLAVALVLAYNGAAGETREELARALGLEGHSPVAINQAFLSLIQGVREQPDRNVELTLASSIWADSGGRFTEAFVQAARECCEADAYAVPFSDPATVGKINGWVSEKTQRKIDAMVQASDLASGAGCVLLNAVYFRGRWAIRFDPSATSRSSFTLSYGQRSEVLMMRQAANLPYLETEQFQAVGLPYKGQEQSMYVFCPREGAHVDPSGWDIWIPQLAVVPIELTLPRFTVECASELVPTLAALGLDVALRPGADFSPMGLTDQYIQAVRHRARLEVDEEGTEAAAATVVLLGRSLRRPPSMVVDRPFYVLIQDSRTGALLFLGHIRDPRQGVEGPR